MSRLVLYPLLGLATALATTLLPGGAGRILGAVLRELVRLAA
jgi:hypothetical protein